MVRSLFVRSTHYFFGLLSVRILSLVVFLVLAKRLQPAEFGSLAYFLTLQSLFTLIADWGLTQWYQVKHTQSLEDSLLAAVGQSRFVTIFISIGLFFIYNAMTSTYSILASLLFVISLFPEALLSVSDGFFLVRKQNKRIIAKQLLKLLIPSFFLMFFPQSVTVNSMIWIFIFSSVVTAIWYVPKKLLMINLNVLSVAQKTLRESSQFAILIMASAFYSRGDQVVIQTSLGQSALGMYSAAYRYLDGLSVFPSALAQNLFHLSVQQQFTPLKVVKMVGTMLVLGTLAGSILFIGSRFFTVLLLGSAYTESEQVLLIFSIVTVLIFVNSPLSTLVQSSSLLKSFLPFGILNTVVNISLNILFVPIYGITAAAWVMVVSELTGLLINVYFVHKRMIES